jgi:sulfite reductase (NADPH) flavoprotein alpha-component
VLTNLHTAFSRDQAQKIYVQDRMLEQGRELWAWLDAGAHFYVCGDAQRMARDVDATLRLIAVQHGGLSEEKAAEFVKDLASAGRYLRDVY